MSKPNINDKCGGSLICGVQHYTHAGLRSPAGVTHTLLELKCVADRPTGGKHSSKLMFVNFERRQL